MWYWLAPLLFVAYLFGAGLVSSLCHNGIDGEFAGDEIAFGVFWPMLMAAMIIVAPVVLIIWGGIETARIPRRHRIRMEKRKAERLPDLKRIAALEIENEIGK